MKLFGAYLVACFALGACIRIGLVPVGLAAFVVVLIVAHAAHEEHSIRTHKPSPIPPRAIPTGDQFDPMDAMWAAQNHETDGFIAVMDAKLEVARKRHAQEEMDDLSTLR